MTIKNIRFAAALLLCTAAMSATVSAETNYISMPFEGDNVQKVDVYTGEAVVLVCEKEGELYIWGGGKAPSHAGGASLTMSPEETVTNTYKADSCIQWYDDGYYYSVSVKNGENEETSKIIKFNVLYKKGDVNGDAKTDKADAAEVLKIICGTLEPDEKKLYAADFYEDGEIDLRDAIAILKNK